MATGFAAMNPSSRRRFQLIGHLAEAAGIQPGARILDVGCGFGASGVSFLAGKYGAQATGITISPVHVEMANKAAANAGGNARFLRASFSLSSGRK